jgi:flagellar hook-basal body protein
MGLYGMMRTGVSGMNAQANKLSAVADNIANAGTNGYKRSTAEFSSLVLPSTAGNYNSGSVTTEVRHTIGAQGGLSFTSSTTDLAIDGAGFFVVQDKNGTPFLTRAGSFVPNSDGDLINLSGFTLMGYPYPFSGTANGFDGMVPISLDQSSFSAKPTTNGTFTVNLPSESQNIGQAIINLRPSENNQYSAWNHKNTVTTFDPGGLSTTETYFTKIADNRWEVTVVNTYGGTPSGFPYDLASGKVELHAIELEFDPVTGALTKSSPVIETGQGGDFDFDLSGLTQAITGGSSPQLKVNMNFPSTENPIDPASGDKSPSDNTSNSAYTGWVTLRGYAGFPQNVSLNLYYARTGPDTWDVAVFDSTTATSIGSSEGFPYGTAGSPPLGRTTLQFDMSNGHLINGGDLNVTLPNGETWPIDFSDSMSVADSTMMPNEGVFSSLNLSNTAPIIKPSVLGQTPAQNSAVSTFSQKTWLVAYDNLGAAVTLDVYFTKGADLNWEVAVFNRADAAASGGFPYGTPGTPPLATSLMRFDPQNGKLLEGGVLKLAIPNGETMSLDLTASTQLAGKYQVSVAELNGNAPSSTTDTFISDDGIVYSRYADGKMEALYQLAIASVASPDRLNVQSGNLFTPSADSGNVTIGSAGSGGLGRIKTGALESSNVDIAQELTDMIEAQRSYTANSKVFQTGSELMDVLVNLKR